MGMLRIMSRHGDDQIVWDTRCTATSDAEAEAAICEAERIFTQARLQGGTAFKIDTNKTTTRIEQFDRTAEHILIVPRVVGG